MPFSHRSLLLFRIHRLLVIVIVCHQPVVTQHRFFSNSVKFYDWDLGCFAQNVVKQLIFIFFFDKRKFKQTINCI